MRSLRTGAGIVLFLMLSASACGAPRATTGDHSILTADEIASVNVANMHDVVRLRRPRWLRRAERGRPYGTAQSSELVVYLDSQRFGGHESLRQITPASVYMARYLSPTEADARFGTGHLGGVIQLLTKATTTTP